MPSRPRALSAEFTQTYRAHVGLVWRALARRNVAAADLEDTTQEVFMIAHRRWGAWEGHTSLRVWLFGVARHVANAYHRGARRQQRKLDALPPPADQPLLDHRVDAQARLDALAVAIQALPPDRRDVFVLADVEGFSAPEIAEALGCKLNTVYSRLRRARVAINETMAEPNPGQERRDG
ncbi:MAG TPA: RNA polymerase sigma factor [Enhygromyxa sp.]|nr:RNA polymerase sigma factor [Enhygromyxa sp.]